MKKIDLKKQIKEDIYSILKEGRHEVEFDLENIEASVLEETLENLIDLRIQDTNFLEEVSEVFLGLHNTINRLNLDENSTKDQEEYNDELEKTVSLEKEISKVKKDSGDMNESPQTTEDLIKYALEIINDKDEYATSSWKYMSLKNVILSLAKHNNLNEDIDDDEVEPTKAQVNKKDSVTTIANKLGETKKEMQTVLGKYKKAEGADKEKFLNRLKALTKIKKELESLL